jgi:hypothetical protein
VKDLKDKRRAEGPIIGEDFPGFVSSGNAKRLYTDTQLKFSLSLSLLL